MRQLNKSSSETVAKGKPARDAKRKQDKGWCENTFSNKQLKGVNTKTMIRDKKRKPCSQ